ncbi:MAG: hypothetical protein NVV82_29495 [Sporocytophaga sp.]|nr:hypothetical protein [Sporocytophaga sp.]
MSLINDQNWLLTSWVGWEYFWDGFPEIKNTNLKKKLKNYEALLKASHERVI